MAGEDELLVTAVKDFCEKEIENFSIGLERGGFTPQLVAKIAEQGFLALRLSQDKGGAGISTEAYLKMLKEFAVHSPSVSALVMTVNSVILPVLENREGTSDLIQEIISGKIIPGIPVDYGSANGKPGSGLEANENKVTGKLNFITGFGWDAVLADAGKGNIALVSGEPKTRSDHNRLGLRGLSFYSAEFENAECTEFKTENQVKGISDLFEDLSLETAAIALGIAEGSLTKALEYARVRSTFEHLLKDYQPVAFPLTRLLGEKEILQEYLFNHGEFSESEKLYARIVAVELAKNAARQSIQTHGGYGYLEDFGVEKFYRDSMALSVMFGNRISEQKRLSNLVFESDSGFI